MIALPKIVTAGTFDPHNTVMGEVVYAKPLSRRQRCAMIRRTKRFCVEHCHGSSNRVNLQFQGATMRIGQSAAWSPTKPFTKFHFSMLLNQKLGGPVPDKAPQEPPVTQEIKQPLTAVSVA